MGRYGFGFGGNVRSAVTAISTSSSTTVVIPGETWNGTAGSGFASVPVDPVRATAKPACRLLVPPFQWFTGQIVVGVAAAANNSGSLLDNMGLEKVVVHYEGSTAEIVQPSYYSFLDVNGQSRTYFGWWAVLKHNGINGNARVYFEAVPKDPTMQRRIVGPYQFSPKAAAYSHQIEVAATPSEVAGSRYRTLQSAWNYLKAQNATNPLVTITEAGSYELTGPTGGWANGSHSNGYVHLTASAPVTLMKSPPAAYTFPAAFAVSMPMHIFGNAITIDFANAVEFGTTSTTNRNHWFDGVTLTNSNGRVDYLAHIPRNGTAWLIRATGGPTYGPWATECTFSNLWNAGIGLELARGNTVNQCWGDLFNGTHCVVDNRVDDFDSTDYVIPIPSLTVTYNGGGATATLERGASNTFTAKVDGVSVGSFVALSTPAGWAADVAYTVQNFVAWLNGLTGWSAALLNNTRVAWSLVPQGSGLIPGAWAARNVKGVTLTLDSTFDIHADWYQLQSGGNRENVVIADNITTDFVGQIFHTEGNFTDVVVLNNAWHIKDPWPGGGNRLNARGTFHSRVQSHSVFAHNTVAGQIFRISGQGYLGSDMDSHCLIANNALNYFEWFSGTDASPTIKDNHFFEGASDIAYAVGTTVGGAEADLFADAAAGDFTPQGALLANLKGPVLRRDAGKVSRTIAAPAGAIA